MKTIEEKAKAYDEAIERAKKHCADYVVETIFPELKESEDEGMRKEIINFLKHYPNIIVKKERRNDWIAWLEKQGEQKPAWSEHDETCLIEALGCIKVAVKHAKNQSELCDCGMVEDWNKSIKDRVQPQPKQEWSEEDKKMLKDTIRFCELCGNQASANWLKSLRPQNKWKPSKEQIIALRWILNNVPYNKHKEEISGLLDQIKEL